MGLSYLNLFNGCIFIILNIVCFVDKDFYNFFKLKVR